MAGPANLCAESPDYGLEGLLHANSCKSADQTSKNLTSYIMGCTVKLAKLDTMEADDVRCFEQELGKMVKHIRLVADELTSMSKIVRLQRPVMRTARTYHCNGVN